MVRVAPLFRAALFALLPWLPVAAAADAASARFDAGVAAFRARQFDAARADFLAARAAGLDTAQLQFDLGLVNYELGRYDEAKAAFTRLRGFPGYESIADFHLGLVAARTGAPDRARELWQEVEHEAPEEALRERARVARARLNGGATASAYVLATVGRDSNPALVEESLQGGGAASSVADLSGSLDVPVSQDGDATGWLQGGAYLRDYAEDHALDQRGLFLGFAEEQRAGGRRSSWSAEVSTHQLDGMHFMDIYGFGAAAEPRAGGNGLALRGALARIQAASGFDYLQGWRLRAELEDLERAGPVRVRTGYQFEGNARADLATGNEFFSYSPLRHRLSLTLDHPLGAGWFLQESARYRYSWYQDSNRFLEGGVLVERRRVENLLQAGLQLRRRLGATLDWLVEYQYSRNTASIDAFGYHRQVLSTGLEWTPHG